MTPMRLVLVVPFLFSISILHALPWLPRPSRLFGIAVPPAIRYGSEGRRLIRLYQLQLLPVTAGAFLASCVLASAGDGRALDVARHPRPVRRR